MDWLMNPIGRMNIKIIKDPCTEPLFHSWSEESWNIVTLLTVTVGGWKLQSHHRKIETDRVSSKGAEERDCQTDKVQTCTQKKQQNGYNKYSLQRVGHVCRTASQSGSMEISDETKGWAEQER